MTDSQRKDGTAQWRRCVASVCILHSEAAWKSCLACNPPAASLDGREEFEKADAELIEAIWHFKDADTRHRMRRAIGLLQASRASDRERVAELEATLAYCRAHHTEAGD